MQVDGLLQVVRQQFGGIKEHRARNCQYPLVDNLMAGFAVFHQKDPSLLAFREQYPARSANLQRIYGLGQLPEDTALRGCLDGVEPDLLQATFGALLEQAKQAGVLAAKRVLDQYLAVSFDGTGYFASSAIRCEHCLERRHRSGMTFEHQLLGAVLVHPDQTTVLPVFAEPIIRTDGKGKNDCERNACKRLIPKVRALLPEVPILAVLDALYADGPTVKALRQADMDFLITIKDGYVPIQVEALRRQGPLAECQQLDGAHRVTLRWANNLILNGVHQEQIVHYLECEQHDTQTGELLYKNAWITSLPIRADNAYAVSQVARSRWKIENETFNTLKNQGYQLEHNFGHGKKYLCSVFALLMLLAFAVDQLAQAADTAFQKALAQFKTRKAFFKRVNAVFDLIPSLSMNAIYRFIAGDLTVTIQQLE